METKDSSGKARQSEPIRSNQLLVLMHLYNNQVNIDEPKNAFKEIEAEETLPKYFRNAELLSKPTEIKIPEEKNLK